MEDTPTPWDLHPALSEERLVAIGALIRRVRGEALEMHEPLKGEGSWSLGARVYERTMHALVEASKDWLWLGTMQAGLQFCFFIDGVPVKFYRGDAEDPNPRSMKTAFISETERQAIQLALFKTDNADDVREWFWRLCIEVDDRGAALRILLHQAAADGETRNHWVVPSNDTVTVLTPFAPPAEGVDLPPPVVTAKPANDVKQPKEATNDE